MIFSQHSYSVLIVSDSAKMNEVLSGILPPALYMPVRIVTSVASAKRAVLEREYDLLIVNSPLSDEPGVSFAADQCANRATVALLLMKASVYPDVSEQAVFNGVFLLPKPTTVRALETAVQWMTAARERLRRVGEKEKTLEETMQEIQLVNRAKWRLIGRLGLSETEAHRYIEKQAMDRSVSKYQIAKEIIAADASVAGGSE